MKKSIFTMLLLVACTAAAMAEKVHFTIHGAAPDSVKNVVLYNLNNNKELANLTVADGKFTFTDSLEDNTFVIIVSKESKENCICVADGATVYANIGDGTAMGTRLTNKVNAFENEMEQYDEAFKNIKKGLATLTDTTKLSQLKQLRKATKKMLHQQTVKEIEDNKNNIIPAYILYFHSDALDFDDTYKYVNSNNVYASHPLLAQLKPYLEASKAQHALIGQQIKDFSITDEAGKVHKLSEFTGKGKYTLVDFWASWCGPCMREMPNVKANYDKYHAKGFNVIGVSLDSKKDAWQKAIHSNNLSWQHFCDFKAWNNEGVKLYDIKGIPWNFICDSTGKILDIELRDDALGDKLEELFGE